MTVTGLFKGIKAEFQNLTMAPERMPYTPFIQEINSMSNAEDYWIPASVGNVRPLLDGIQLQELSDKKLTIVNKPYYDGIREDRMNILNSQEYLSANIINRINSVVNAWQSFRVNSIDDMISNNGTAFDGTAFFSSSGRNNIKSWLSLGTNTTVYGANQSTGAGYDTSSIWADVATARANLWDIRDINKRYFNDPNNTNLYVWCPVSMRDQMEKIFNPGQALISIGGVMVNNPYSGIAKIVTYQSTTHNWILANANAPVKPFIIQNRMAPEWFIDDNNKYPWIDYYYKAYIGFGYGSPFSMYRVTNA